MLHSYEVDTCRGEVPSPALDGAGEPGLYSTSIRRGAWRGARGPQPGFCLSQAAPAPCHARESGHPGCFRRRWIPACAGMTMRWPSKAGYRVHGNDRLEAGYSSRRVLIRPLRSGFVYGASIHKGRHDKSPSLSGRGVGVRACKNTTKSLPKKKSERNATLDQK